MKTVKLTFAGLKSEEMAKKFYSYLVDGGLEDQLIQALSGDGVTLGISDCNTKDLDVLFHCEETKPVKKAPKKPIQEKKPEVKREKRR